MKALFCKPEARKAAAWPKQHLSDRPKKVDVDVAIFRKGEIRMVQQHVLRTVRIAVAILAMLGTSARMAVPANAATTSVQVAAAGSITKGVPGSRVTPALGPYCYTHTPPPELVDFRVVGASAVVCTAPMQLLEATYELEWNGIVVEQDIRTGSTAVGVGASSPCMPGTYSAKLTLDLKWPVGVTGITFYTESSGPFTTTC